MLSLWLLLAGSILLLILALRSRVVVFFDTRDLACTLAAPAIVLLGLIVRHSLLPAPDDPAGTTALSDGAWILALGVASISLLVSFAFSVWHNGLLVGAFVFVFKHAAIVAALLLAVLLWPAKGRGRMIVVPIAALAGVALLVNGRRVLAARQTRLALRGAAASRFSRANLGLRVADRSA